jgi:hypothetical protein
MVYSLDVLSASGVRVKKRSQWGSRYPVSRYALSLPGRYLFMHITVTHQTGNLDFRTRVVERIGAQRFKNTRFPYTALLHPGGEIHEGQPRGRKGAHTVNDKNVSGYPHDLNAHGHALAYCGMPGDAFGEAEIESAARYFAALVLSGESTADRILPHNKFAFKECPADPVMQHLDEINRRFRRYVANGALPNTEDELPTARELAAELATNDDFLEAVAAVVRKNVWLTPNEAVEGSPSYRTVLNRIYTLASAGLRPEDVARVWSYRNSAVEPDMDAYALLRAAATAPSLLDALRPLFEAAAENRALSDEDVAAVAAACREAVGEATSSLAKDLLAEAGAALSAHAETG